MAGHAVGMIEMGSGGGGRVMVTADLTSSMPAYYGGIATTLIAVATSLGGEWGLVSHMDYGISAVLSNGQTAYYGILPEDYAFRINTGWTTPAAFVTAVKALPTNGYGNDSAENYSRVLWELSQADTIRRLGGAVNGWTLMVLDSLPHWRGGPTGNQPWTDSIDPGRRADGSSATYPYIGGFNIDFVRDGINPLRAQGSKICVWDVYGYNPGFWTRYADAYTSVTPGSAGATIRLKQILSS